MLKKYDISYDGGSMNKKFLINILFLLFLFLLFFASIITRELYNLDEIWNFNFARNVANGLIPYNDFNMVQTPLMAIFNGILLKTFGINLVVFRVIAALLGSAIIFLSFKILKKLNVNNILSLISSVFLFLYIKNGYYLDYNYMNLFITLIIIYLELNSKKTIKYNILVGFLASLTILFKQSTGLFICVITCSYILINNLNKDTFKLFLYRVIGAIIPIIILFIYLMFTNSLASFIDYAILGIKTFTNSISYKNILNINPILGILVPLFILYFLISGIKNNNKNNLILGVFSLASFIVIYPIADMIHFKTASFITILGIVYLMFINIKLNKNIVYITSTIIFIPLVIFIITRFNYYINTQKSELLYFYNIPINKDVEKNILLVDEFIKKQEKDVYILDADASLYMIPLNRYNKNYDLFLKGNLGNTTISKEIEKINNMENVLFLVKSEGYELNWQMPVEVVDFVRNNLKNVGTIYIFDIYEK